MNIRSLFVSIGKLLLCGLVFSIGTFIGGMVVAILGLPQPTMPEWLDASSAMLYLLVESPLLALVLALLARHLAVGFWVRSLMLFLLVWISNSLNNQIEAAAFAGMAEGFWFTVITFLFPALFISMAVAWLFPPFTRNTFKNAAKLFFARYSVGGWIWRRSSSCPFIISLGCW